MAHSRRITRNLNAMDLMLALVETDIKESKFHLLMHEVKRLKEDVAETQMLFGELMAVAEFIGYEY